MLAVWGGSGRDGMGPALSATFSFGVAQPTAKVSLPQSSKLSPDTVSLLDEKWKQHVLPSTGAASYAELVNLLLAERVEWDGGDAPLYPHGASAYGARGR